jgi:hypothetical protein
VGSDPKMPAGVTHSAGEARVPPLKDKYLNECLDQVFDEQTNAVAMADSAMAYRNLKVARFSSMGVF